MISVHGSLATRSLYEDHDIYLKNFDGERRRVSSSKPDQRLHLKDLAGDNRSKTALQRKLFMQVNM